MAIFIFLVILFVLVLVHEWGHYFLAKRTGMRVDEFGIGFPPKLWSVKKGETEYSLNALPIGGFVKIFGEDAVGARESGDYERSFAAKSKWAQAAVLVAGVAMNVLFAWFVFAAAFMIGVPTAVEEDQASDAARLVVSNVLPDSPAAAAELPVGAEIVALTSGPDRAATLTPSAFSAFTESHSELAVTYRLDGEERTVALTPAAGVIETEPNRPAVGVALALIEEVSRPLPAAVIEATVTTGAALKAITIGLGTLIADSIRGQADLSQVAGPVGIVGVVGDAASFGLVSLLMITAVISLNLAVINLLPFPALDGGRLVFVALEAIIRRPINPVWSARANAVGFALLILLMVAITFNDISRIL